MPSNKCISSMPTVSFDVNYIIFLQDRLFKTVSEQYICSWFCWRSSCYVLHIQAFSTYKTVDHPYFRIIPCHRCLPTIRWTSASSDSSVTLLFETAGVLFSWRRSFSIETLKLSALYLQHNRWTSFLKRPLALRASHACNHLQGIMYILHGPSRYCSGG